MDGEHIVSQSGLYTFIHTYEHLSDKRRVILCGMSHIGEKKYYTKVKNALLECDMVLYEPIFADTVKHNIESLKSDENWAENLNEFLVLTISAYYLKSERVLKRKGLALEGYEFSKLYGLENWIHADLLPKLGESEDLTYSIVDALYRRIRRLSVKTRSELLEFFCSSILKMESGKFGVRDFARDLVEIDGREDFFKTLIGATFQKNRDRKCFEIFDYVVKEHSPSTIGIKFGMAHLPYQRTLLERRGYRLVSSKKICYIHF